MFSIDGKQSSTEYRLFVLVLFFAGDTMEHNKLCSLRGGSMSTFPCRMCSTTSKNLDNPANVPNDKLTIGSKIKEL